jgi:hypothetical protein
MTDPIRTLIAASLLTAVASAQEPGFVSLDEMEGDVAARWGDVAGTATLTLEPDEQTVKEGEASGRWDTDRAAPAIYLAAGDLPTDWEAFGALEVWVHSAEATGAVFAIALYSENPATEGEDYYRCLVPVDWEGWRFFHLEPRSFARSRSPVGWRQVDSLRFAIAGWNDLKQAPGTVLCFDALRLARGTSTPEHRVLFDPDTDWSAWWTLPYTTSTAKTGRYSTEWYPAEDGAAVANRSVPRDWSGSAYLNLWLYCEGTQGATLTVGAVSNRPESAERDAYETVLKLDWEAWRLLSLPLTSFARQGDPVGWQAIDELRLAVADAAPASRLCLDEVWLSVLPGDAAAPPQGGGEAPPPLGVAAAPTVAAPGGVADTGPKVSLPTESETERLLKEALTAKRSGDLELAFTKYIAVLLRDARSVEAHWGLAWVLAAKNEKEAAVEHFQQVLQLSTDPQRLKEARAALQRLKAPLRP